MPDPDREFEGLTRAVAAAFEAIGLNLVNAAVATNSTELAEKLQTNQDVDMRSEADDNSVIMEMAFVISENAFYDRNLDPEKHAADTEFRMIVPTEAEVIAETMKDLKDRGFGFESLDDGDET